MLSKGREVYPVLAGAKATVASVAMPQTLSPDLCSRIKPCSPQDLPYEFLMIQYDGVW
eukprot:CAMPEP_0175915844 /NCGR_PEP_ID=MMETSP0108-20121206/10529_1 /TAXON_ID=195067 ORGANISM="Goniomonas pacifica, Strain CCMP1869" /NCGR_SAMPLE_ID=MMETSP0108 /ASSEMBLY_ACC=CAM_ASM_000204 /LENGTH=57 /DNA_ID=CAMNT_0017238355 /DNA_START=79 /DNA_END=249 /DNA_ORIENTATION=+